MAESAKMPLPVYVCTTCGSRIEVEPCTVLCQDLKESRNALKFLAEAAETVISREQIGGFAYSPTAILRDKLKEARVVLERRLST